LAAFDADFFIEKLKTTKVTWAKKILKSIKFAFLWGKNIILAMRGRQRENELGKAVIVMRKPQRNNGFGKAVIDNLYTLPRFARTSERQWIMPQT